MRSENSISREGTAESGALVWPPFHRYIRAAVFFRSELVEFLTCCAPKIDFFFLAQVSDGYGPSQAHDLPEPTSTIIAAPPGFVPGSCAAKEALRLCVPSGLLCCCTWLFLELVFSLFGLRTPSCSLFWQVLDTVVFVPIIGVFFGCRKEGGKRKGGKGGRNQTFVLVAMTYGACFV